MVKHFQISVNSHGVGSANSELPDPAMEEDVNADQIASTTIDNASMFEKIVYKQENLLKITSWLSGNFSAFQIKSMRDELLTLTQSESDEVYLEDMYLYAVQNGATENEAVLESLQAFKSIVDGEAWYPTLRIDNDHLIYNVTVMSTGVYSDSADNPDLIIAIEDHDGTTEVYSPFLPGEDDNLIPYEGPFNEEAVDDTPLLIIELTDPCSGTSIQPAYVDVICDTDPISGGGFDPPAGGTERLLQIDDMKIKDRKEGWPGRSEIEFKGYKLDVPTMTPNITIDCGQDVYASRNCYNGNGKRIKHMRYSDEGDNFDVNWTIAKDENFTSDVLVYVIFEYDSWPAPKKSAYQDLPNGATSLIEYRSYEADYNKQVLSQDQSLGYPYVYGFSYDGRWIEYNLRSWW